MLSSCGVIFLSTLIKVYIQLTFRRYIDKADAARALSIQYIVTDRVRIYWYEQRPLWSEYTEGSRV